MGDRSWACDGQAMGTTGASWRLLTTGCSCRPRPDFKQPRAKNGFYIFKSFIKEKMKTM